MWASSSASTPGGHEAKRTHVRTNGIDCVMRGERTSTTGRRDEAHGHAAALSRHLCGYGVWLADLVTPVTAADGDDGHLGRDDRATDGGGDLLGALDAEAAVAVVVADDDKGLEARALAGAGLLLYGHDLHDLVLEGAAEELLDDLVLLHGQGEEVDLLHGLDLHGSHGGMSLRRLTGRR